MFTWKDALLLRWAFSSQTVRYRNGNELEIKTGDRLVRGKTDFRSLVQYLVLGTIAFLFMAGCALAIFLSNANIFILVVCVPLGGIATLFWLIYGFLLVSEVVLGSR